MCCLCHFPWDDDGGGTGVSETLETNDMLNTNIPYIKRYMLCLGSSGRRSETNAKGTLANSLAFLPAFEQKWSGLVLVWFGLVG